MPAPNRDGNGAVAETVTMRGRNLAVGALVNRVILTIALAAGSALSAAQPVIRFEPPVFRVTGWGPMRVPEPGDWPQVFAVYAGEGDVPQVLGSYRVVAGDLIFEPRYPLRKGLRYRAVFRLVQPEVAATFEIPAEHKTPSTRVEHIYPSIDVLPDNQLKFYVTFSAPMQRGEAWRRIHLYDAAGKQVELPFLELQQELWDPDHRRLTVLFDPGRIKRGLLPLQEAGPAIENGRQYKLVIDREWMDAAGAPLTAGFSKSFRAAPADRTPPDPKDWRITAPAARGRSPLVLDFPKPLDYALLLHLIDVVDAAGRPVAGSVSVEQQERRWKFTPDAPWQAGSYKIRIDTSLEDLAGNRIGRPFDVDTFERVERPEKKQVMLSFRTRGQ